MSERLVFGYGTSGHRGEAPRAGQREPEMRPPCDAGVVTSASKPSATSDRRDWAFSGLMIFTALLFFRPQDQVPALDVLHLAEISALVGLGAMVLGRLRRGLPVTRVTPELTAVVALGAIILITAPFSIWMGGAVGTFTELYVKIILIFVLMVNTLNSPKRIEQFAWLLVVATAYLAFRAVLDYGRGINLVENNRVQGAVGGMFRNPNDLALNMVAVLPLAASFALRRGPMFGRLTAAASAALMVAAVIASHSRSGSMGLVAMTLILAGCLVKRRPGLVMGGALALVLALPLVPSSYWHRLSSITDDTRDETRSREARTILMRDAFATFVAHPIAGVGAGQFKNYKPDERQVAWRESHNAILQIASELGVFGLAAFGFLIVRGAGAGLQVRRLLRRSASTRSTPRAHRTLRTESRPRTERNPQREDEAIAAHSAAMAAAMAGWFVCALFASVAYNWTFYYLLALAIAPREILIDRLGPARGKRRAPLPASGAVMEARA